MKFCSILTRLLSLVYDTANHESAGSPQSLVDAHTVAQNQYTEKKIENIHFFFVMALCYVQKCELSYNVLGKTQNCIPPSEIIIPNGECVIRLGIGVGTNVIFKQVSHTIR